MVQERGNCPLRRADVLVVSVDNAYNIRLNTCLVEHTESYIAGGFVVVVTDVLSNKPIAYCSREGGNVSRVEDDMSLSYDKCFDRVKRLMHSETWWQWLQQKNRPWVHAGR